MFTHQEKVSVIYEKNNPAISLNVLFYKNIYPAYISKHNSNHKKQIILLKVLNEEGWYYLAVTRLSPLSGVIASNNTCDFYFQNCLHLPRKKIKPKSHKVSMQK